MTGYGSGYRSAVNYHFWFTIPLFFCNYQNLSVKVVAFVIAHFVAFGQFGVIGSICLLLCRD